MDDELYAADLTRAAEASTVAKSRKARASSVGGASSPAPREAAVPKDRHGAMVAAVREMFTQ